MKGRNVKWRKKRLSHIQLPPCAPARLSLAGPRRGLRTSGGFRRRNTAQAWSSVPVSYTHLLRSREPVTWHSCRIRWINESRYPGRIGRGIFVVQERSLKCKKAGKIKVSAFKCINLHKNRAYAIKKEGWKMIDSHKLKKEIFIWINWLLFRIRNLWKLLPVSAGAALGGCG